ncbi:DNA topoisomerase-3 [Acetitomaculum ruminis DSM 5522]|uniref:DNA topoisomerase n=1 Tax=Acetitomaculum ruminis DSM 5522 TaxID=1120918 RepID=A0A1I0V036_9FIRM|nr:DNA topoisomerase [Acetitomaculum ruminis]SFA69699.1 DNA topoisomerase-3 [Acetitomaculum ruminis DSM 5522]
MNKALYIAEKPSVAKEFAKAIKDNFSNKDGYMESENSIVTWCVGHLVTMSYPDAYNPELKKWTLETLPFIPEEFKYEIIPQVSKQFKIVSRLLNREDVSTIYVCTDSGREGEYIYRLVAQMAGVKDKEQKRVWIDSQTEEEILRGIKEAKDISAYDDLSDAAYLRAKEDYLMGINFSRVLSLKYAGGITYYLQKKYSAISVGRVMTCVLGMVVRREREIRNFVKTPFYKVNASFQCDFDEENNESFLEGEWKVHENSKYFNSPKLYKDNGFLEKDTAKELIDYLQEDDEVIGKVISKSSKKENKNPPLLYNLAELQNECSRLFKISPDDTLKVVQELYEKKLVTYPRTDARVLSTAIGKEIHKNIKGLLNIDYANSYARWILEKEKYKNINKSRYVNDKQITDHYAIIPTGQGFNALTSVSNLHRNVYEVIVKRFLSIFCPPAVYQKNALVIAVRDENFHINEKILVSEGYLKLLDYTFIEEKKKKSQDECFISADVMAKIKKGTTLKVNGFAIKEGETTPPKRYNSGSMILAMENAGNLIEDEELRAQINGSGIGTSATRAEILKKLENIAYISLNKKTQIITPSQMGEMVYDVVNASIRSLLNPELTASWEKGLTMVANGEISKEEYMDKLTKFVTMHTLNVRNQNNSYYLRGQYDLIANYYQKSGKNEKKSNTTKSNKENKGV